MIITSIYNNKDSLIQKFASNSYGEAEEFLERHGYQYPDDLDVDMIHSGGYYAVFETIPSCPTISFPFSVIGFDGVMMEAIAGWLGVTSFYLTYGETSVTIHDRMNGFSYTLTWEHGRLAVDGVPAGGGLAELLEAGGYYGG